MKKIFSELLSVFFQGLLFVMPIGLTLYIVAVVFFYINDLTNEWTEFLFGFKIPGFGVLITFSVITLIGLVGSHLLSKKMLEIIHQFITKIPVINSVYSSIKDVLSAFVGKGKKFSNPVSFKISDDSQIEMLGFITQKDVSKLGITGDKVSVYSPLSYGMMGRVMIVPASYVTPLTCSTSELMKYILSGGLTEIIEKGDKKDDESINDNNNQEENIK